MGPVNGLPSKKNNMTYKDTLTKLMTDASFDDNTIFIGQQIVFKGNPMSTTIENIDKNKMIEVPVMEETQMGMTLGLGMMGFRVVSFYPRWDFLVSATNQLVNHLDKYQIMTNETVHIIIRIAKGSDKPLDPGVQHKSNHIEEYKSLCKNIKFMDCKSASDLIENYELALKNKGIYVINEYPELYNL